MNVEQKSVMGIETKLASVESDTGLMEFEGYGAVFGNVDAYGDVIAKGAFKDTLAQHAKDGTAPLMFLNHDLFGSIPVGKWTAMSEDDYGLMVKGTLLDTTAGRDIYTALKADALNGLSIGFIPTKWEMRQSADQPRRTLQAVDLIEVSVVTIPANSKARVSDVKTAVEDMTVRDLEHLLRECGLSKSQAIAIAAQFESKKQLEAIELKRLEDEQFEARLRALLNK